MAAWRGFGIRIQKGRQAAAGHLSSSEMAMPVNEVPNSVAAVCALRTSGNIERKNFKASRGVPICAKHLKRRMSFMRFDATLQNVATNSGIV